MDNINVFIDNDQDLQTLLTTALPLVVSMKIAARMFAEIPQEEYNRPIPESLGGNGAVRYCDVFKDFCEGNEDVENAYILVGEHLNTLGKPKQGCRDLKNFAMTKEEIQAWLDYLGVEAFHVGFPRIEVGEI